MISRFLAGTFTVAVCILGSMGAAQSSSDTLATRLDALFDHPRWSNAHWGVKIVDLTTSEILYEREANKGFMPASNMKLYTTAAALYVLGPNYRWKTRVCVNAPVKNGVLDGDIVIVGSGDPSISGRYVEDTPTTSILKNWSQVIRDAGIKRVTGAVVGDDDVFDDDALPGTWQLDYYQDWYAAESSGLAINENCWDVIITPGKKIGAPAIVRQLFPTKYYKIDAKNMITTGALGKPDEDPDVTITRSFEDNDVALSGTIAIDAKPYKEWGALRNGTLYTSSLLVEELQRQGVRVARGPKDIDDLEAKERYKGDNLRTLVEHESVTLSRTLSIINKPSQNFYADQLLKTLGKEVYGKGSFDDGERVVRDFLTSAGAANSNHLQMVDGSGLSRQNLVEPQMTMALLQTMAAHPDFQVFYDSLPIMGVDGTLKKRARGTLAEGRVHAKTGFIGRVRSLSGYVDNDAGHRIAFTTMANNYTVDTKYANDTQDSVTVELIKYRGE